MILEFESLEQLLIFNIKYYRYVRKYSQEFLAELSGLTPEYISDIERGKHMPTISKIELIAKSFEIEPYELFINKERDIEIISKINDSRQYNQRV